MDITKFISKKSHEEVLIGNFSTLAKKVKSKKELRILEMNLLKPKPIPIYTGQKTSGRSNFKKKSLLITFPDKSYIEKISNICKINTYIENNTYDIDFLIELIRLLESKRIIWNKERKKYYLKKKGKRLIKI